MKVLHINCAESGSTGKIIEDISDYAYSREAESVLCVPKITYGSSAVLKKYAVSMPLEQGVYRRISYITGIPYGFSPISTRKVLRVVKKEKPDVVHLHCTNGCFVNVYRLVNFLKKEKIATVVTNHAEFFYTGNCSHSEECLKWQTGCGSCPMLKKATGSRLFDRTHTAWRRMKKAFDGFERIIIASVSDWVKERAMKSPILNSYKNVTVLNGVNTAVFKRTGDGVSDCRYKANADTKIFLHVTSSFNDSKNSIKGGVHLIELAKRFEKDNVKFVVAGPASLKNNDLPSNVLFLGRISDQNHLAQLYRMADLTVLTSKRETFGMAVAESMCCGTPVVGFLSGGSESVAISDFSQFVDFGDVDAMESIIRDKWMDYKNESVSKEIAALAEEKYSSERMAKEYLELYNSLV